MKSGAQRLNCGCIPNNFSCLFCDTFAYLAICRPFNTASDRKKLRYRAKRGKHLLRAGVSIEEVKKIVFEDSNDK